MGTMGFWGCSELIRSVAPQEGLLQQTHRPVPCAIKNGKELWKWMETLTPLSWKQLETQHSAKTGTVTSAAAGWRNKGFRNSRSVDLTLSSTGGFAGKASVPAAQSSRAQWGGLQWCSRSHCRHHPAKETLASRGGMGISLVPARRKLLTLDESLGYAALCHLLPLHSPAATFVIHVLSRTLFIHCAFSRGEKIVGCGIL